MSIANPPSRKAPPKRATPPLLQPRIWLGMPFRVWLGLLAENRFRIDWKLWPVALAITLYTIPVSLAAMFIRLLHGRSIRRTKIDKPPIFVVGHWRSGTTLLHELMVLDERHASPTTYACIVPNLFLYTEAFARTCLGFLMPENRPMDNMKAGWDKPQEDEFALCNMGVASPYRSIAFPNEPPQGVESLTLEGLPADKFRRWKERFEWFLKTVTLSREGKQLVLKSPTHTARISTLLEMFPDARFVHIVRDPYVVFPSTVHLWKTLSVKHGLQQPRHEGLEEYVLDTFTRMYDKFERDRERIPAGHFCEVKYEDLVRDPRRELALIYERLGLDGFEKVEPRLNEYLGKTDGYQTNQYTLTELQRADVSSRWRRFIEQYGYDAS